MNNYVIRPLTFELNADYLDFFDHRAFTDDNPNGPCYCTSPNQGKEQIEKMVSEFKSFGVKETLRKYAVEMLNQKIIQGYLAYDGDKSIGWCNASDIENYVGFVPLFAKKITCGKTMSIVCFEIAPEYRGKGIASAFIITHSEGTVNPKQKKSVKQKISANRHTVGLRKSVGGFGKHRMTVIFLLAYIIQDCPKNCNDGSALFHALLFRSVHGSFCHGNGAFRHCVSHCILLQ